MKAALWAVDKIFGKRIKEHTRQHLAHLANTPALASRARATSLLERLAAEPGPQVHLGETDWGQPVRLPLAHLVHGHSVITGATGAGKSTIALILVEAMLRADSKDLSFGVVDAKGDLFSGTLRLIALRLQELPPPQAQHLKERIEIIDLSSQDPITSYNIASPWSESDLDYFTQTRVDLLEDIFPSGDGLSLRGAGIVKHVIKLMGELRLPFNYFDRVLASESFRSELLARSCDHDLRRYFSEHYPTESRATIAAVRARISAALLSSQSIKVALSGDEAPDFRRMQDEGRIPLIKCGGPNVSRTTARTLQSFLLSDISRAIFARTSPTAFVWLFDEAAQLLRNRHVREALLDFLTLARSYRSFCLYLTQSLPTAVQDRDTLESFYTNVKWAVSLRCGTAHDVSFLEPALPITGRLPKPRVSPYDATQYYRPSEERSLRLSRTSSLPDRVGWLWLKSLTGEAIRIRTRTLTLPEGRAFQDTVESLRADPTFGHRISRAAFTAKITRREAELSAAEPGDQVELLKKAYQEIQGKET
jgi:Helicase HerA, central domain